MFKPASSLCNLRCRYCFYADVSEQREIQSYGIMQKRTTESILETIESSLKPGDHMVFTFQGGEPTLAGLEYFRHFTKLVSSWDKRIHIEYALQTNGILLDDAWCSFLAEHRFLVGVSLDVLPECHDSERVDIKQQGTYSRVQAAIQVLEKHGVQYNILCTLTRAIARHPQKVWKRILDSDFRYVQFTPCMDEMEAQSPSSYALTPQRFSSFYIQLFRLWLRDYKAGQYRSIKFFDDVVNLMLLGIPTACGIDGICRPQLVVEADGSTFPCDFYCLDAYLLGNLTKDSLESILQSPTMRDFHNRPHEAPALCADCRYLKFCGGGCKRMQHATSCVGDADFCGYQTFLDECMEDLLSIVEDQRRLRIRSGQASK